MSAEQAFVLLLVVMAVIGFAVTIDWLIEVMVAVDSQETDE